MYTIVIGVDGSEASIGALRFALDEARMRGGEVKVVAAWHVDPIAYPGAWTPSPFDRSEFPKLAQAALSKSLDQAGAADTETTVTQIVREGKAAEVLCEEARDADLLVVGSRGLGGFRGLLLGSVSQECSHHAPCPVVIVPNARQDATAAP